MSIARYWGVLGLRLGGAIHLVPQEQDASPLMCPRFGCRDFGGGSQNNVRLGAWMADAELIFEPLRAVPALKGLLLGFSPYGFAGIGSYGVHRVTSRDSSFATLNLGLGAHHDLIGPLGLQAEARYRSPLQSYNGITEGWRQNLEYSVGFRVGFGGKKRHPTETASPSAPARPEMAGSEAFVSRVLDVAESYVGTPYRPGGTNPYGGFDAAGFVGYVFGKVQYDLGQGGARLPRTARQIAELGQEVPLRIGSVAPGDLMFFASDGSHIDHVAIYAGHDRIIHATASGGGVRYDVLGDGDRGQWFSDHLVSARRLVGGRGQTPEPRKDGSFDPPDLAPGATGVPR
ncbi:MAG TPA: C40 family peptidase [Gemmatimonadales bacterium]|nr:C40 family peptidase [Gemmatimonadales bacterium]